jgi:hypothetical protein
MTDGVLVGLVWSEVDGVDVWDVDEFVAWCVLLDRMARMER